MDKTSFPAVQAKSSRETLKLLGIDEGDVLRYNPNSGMYVVSKEEEDIGPGENYSYFAESVGFSKSVIDALLEAGIVEEILIPESDEPSESEPEEATTAKDIESWETAELTMVCGRCGNEEKITDAYGGVSLFMPTNSGAETRLACDNCGNTMTLLYRKGRDLTKEEKAMVEEERRKQKEAREKKVERPNGIAQQPMAPDEAYEGPVAQDGQRIGADPELVAEGERLSKIEEERKAKATEPKVQEESTKEVSDESQEKSD